MAEIQQKKWIILNTIAPYKLGAIALKEKVTAYFDLLNQE